MLSLSVYPKDIFQLSEEQFFYALQAENRDFLFTREVSDRDIRRIHRLGRGGAYYVGRLYDLAGKPEAAKQLYRQEYEKGDALWRVEAGHRLLELLLKEVSF